MRISRGIEANLLVAEMTLELNEKQAISLEKLSEYKAMMLEDEFFSLNTDYITLELLILVRNYIISVLTNENVENVTEVVGKVLTDISNNVVALESEFYTKYFIASALNNLNKLDTVSTKITRLLNCKTEGQEITNVIYDLEYANALLKFYLADAQNYIDEIRILSTNMKPKIAAKNEIVKQLTY